MYGSGVKNLAKVFGILVRHTGNFAVFLGLPCEIENRIITNNF